MFKNYLRYVSFPKNVSLSYKPGFISFVAVVPLHFTQASDFRTLRAHFIDKVILSPFFTIFLDNEHLAHHFELLQNWINT